MTTLLVVDDFCVGDEKDVDRQITGLLGPIRAAAWGLAHRGDEAALTISTDAAPEGKILDPGTLDVATGTYTAEVLFVLSGGPAGYTRTFLAPGLVTRGFITVTPVDDTGPYTAATVRLLPTRGGAYG